MFYDETIQEVERRASSPEGMVALFHALLKDFEEAIEPPPLPYHPESRLHYLLRQYVKFKRMYDWFKKDMRWGRSTVISRQKDTYYIDAITNFRGQLRDVYAQIPADRLVKLKKQIGKDIQFSPLLYEYNPKYTEGFLRPPSEHEYTEHDPAEIMLLGATRNNQ